MTLSLDLGKSPRVQGTVLKAMSPTSCTDSYQRAHSSTCKFTSSWCCCHIQITASPDLYRCPKKLMFGWTVIVAWLSNMIRRDPAGTHIIFMPIPSGVQWKHNAFEHGRSYTIPTCHMMNGIIQQLHRATIHVSCVQWLAHFRNVCYWLMPTGVWTSTSTSLHTFLYPTILSPKNDKQINYDVYIQTCSRSSSII